MSRIIYNKYDKVQMNTLPPVAFEGNIYVILNELEAKKAVDFLLTQPVLGVDTETRPSFKKGETHPVSLLQVSTESVCFLFRLNRMGISSSVKRLLENTQVPMIGLSWHDDLLSLHRRGDFTPGLFIDLQDVVGRIGIEDLSLQKLYANIFGKKMSKRQRLSNWDADVLNPKQQLYAATDAWACVMLYKEILALEVSGDYEFVRSPEPAVENDVETKK
ncbi:MAG: 3'-5' exonuclease domain-containing protein 2 [Prevotella sp.]|nr:3'-5' exonuclease domain-containing protein 2 [Prevotella sp.]